MFIISILRLKTFEMLIPLFASPFFHSMFFTPNFKRLHLGLKKIKILQLAIEFLIKSSNFKGKICQLRRFFFTILYQAKLSWTRAGSWLSLASLNRENDKTESTYLEVKGQGKYFQWLNTSFLRFCCKMYIVLDLFKLDCKQDVLLNKNYNW